MSKAKAKIFGVIGAFAETSNLRRRAFNKALAAHGIKQQWNTNEYKELIKIQGGMNRLEKTCPDSDQQLLQSIYEGKNRLFLSGLIEEDHLIPGFEVFCNEVLESGMRVAIASTSHLDTIDVILGNMKTITITREDFAFIGHGGMVERSKPAPDIYNVALDSLQLKPTEVVAIEDTHVNLESAIRAGIEQTIAVPGAFCQEQDYAYSTAQLVLDGYSDVFCKTEDSASAYAVANLPIYGGLQQQNV